MYLVDTNLWIQVVRQRDRAAEVSTFLAAVPRERLFVTDFSVHGIGVVMRRHAMLDRYATFLQVASIGLNLSVVSIATGSLGKVADNSISLNLDFDYAYQYTAAELNSLTLVSLDADFDNTPRGRLTPAAALQRFTDEQRQPQQP